MRVESEERSIWSTSINKSSYLTAYYQVPCASPDPDECTSIGDRRSWSSLFQGCSASTSLLSTRNAVLGITIWSIISIGEQRLAWLYFTLHDSLFLPYLRGDIRWKFDLNQYSTTCWGPLTMQSDPNTWRGNYATQSCYGIHYLKLK